MPSFLEGGFFEHRQEEEIEEEEIVKRERVDVSREQDGGCNYEKSPKEGVIPYADKEVDYAGKCEDAIDPGAPPEAQFHNKGDRKQFNKYGSCKTEKADSSCKNHNVLLYPTGGQGMEAHEKKPAIEPCPEEICRRPGCREDGVPYRPLNTRHPFRTVFPSRC